MLDSFKMAAKPKPQCNDVIELLISTIPKADNLKQKSDLFPLIVEVWGLVRGRHWTGVGLESGSGSRIHEMTCHH